VKNYNEVDVRLHILNLSTRLGQVVSPLPSQDSLDTKLGESQNWSGHWKKRILALPGNEPQLLSHAAHSLTPIQTKLFRL